ncbi:uncharacterized protein RCC_07396 [Ramularia collo-cygni]|uniref:Uncharacterized protein n=1 Tax=Ramularia collo-cygni TaxID=112498 RepID=A0A2D3VKH0_9PEZI|nr:uncharacterized protein RCC_07396 [Ramularia collo-cygni]CZT21533.1 uncharacterized protein RCC_07396 [Ramularia collo-cygni]
MARKKKGKTKGKSSKAIRSAPAAAVPSSSSPPETTSTSTAPQTGIPFFDKFPPEVRILIYELAYTDEEPLKVKPKRNTRTTRRDIAPEKTSAQMCILNRLMVSKTWFNEAVKIFASCTTFVFLKFDVMIQIIIGLPPYFHNNITKLEWRSNHCSAYIKTNMADMEMFSRALPRLKSMGVHRSLDLQYRRRWSPSWPVADVQDFEYAARRQKWCPLLRTLRGLKEFHFLRLDYSFRFGIKGQNEVAWEAWMAAEVTKPKGT